MSRDPDIERRLQNWARWKAGEGAGSGGLGYASPVLGSVAGGGSSGYREPVIPVFDHEAAVTDQAVAALEAELRTTIEAYYLRPGTAFAVAFELDIALRTLHNRVERAFYALRVWFNERETTAQAERQRIERVQQARRPPDPVPLPSLPEARVDPD